MYKTSFNKNIKHLFVYTKDDYDFEPNYVVPHHVFTSENLVTLVLDGHGLILRLRPEHRVSMGSLQRLELVDVTFSEGTFKRVVDGCPCLKDLVIMKPRGLKGIRFTAPNIKSLMLSLDEYYHETVFKIDCPNLKILHIEKTNMQILRLINVSSVNHALVNPYGISYDFKDTVNKFPSIEFLHMGHEAYARLRSCGNWELDLQENRMCCLTLRSGIHGSCLRYIICNLLKSSQCLQELVIYADRDYVCDCNTLVRELSSPSVMRLLKTIIIHQCEKPYKGLIQLIEFVLKSAVKLSKVVINCSSKNKSFSTELLQFINQLSGLPRVSPNAVTFHLMLTT